jgi:uncharacterized protein YprB with RNaseH-like and TPR domain
MRIIAVGIKKSSPLPIHRLKKADLIWLATHRCRHGHTYLEHYACFVSEHPEMQEKIGFLDIECSNLNANFGIILSYCIKQSWNDEIIYGVINTSDIRKYDDDKTDYRIVKKIIDDMLTFDRIITHYGRKFDIPYIRTRALMMDIDFPSFGSIVNDDTWLMARGKLRLNSNRLDTIERALFGESAKTHIDFKYWIAASRGDKTALEYVLDHNKKDVLSLEKVYYKLRDFVGKRNCSI